MSADSENKGDTLRCSPTASRSNTRPVQPHDPAPSRSQKISSTLASEVANDAHDRALVLHGEPMKRGDMEAALRAEIDGAVFEYASFCDEFFAIGDKCTNFPEAQRAKAQAQAQEKHRGVMKTLAQEPLFNHQEQPWTIDCINLGKEDTPAHQTMVKILDTISKAAFERDQFRPVCETIRPCSKFMNAEDPDDTVTQPGVVQVCINSKDRGYWAEMEFFAECKAKPDQLHEALLQLAGYARATLIHQIYRLHVFAIAVCGTEATFVRLGRSGILHSPPIDLSRDFETFAHCAARLFALSPERFGYNTDFYFWPKLTGEPNERRMEPNEDHKPKKLRVKAGNRIWRVVEVLCQRKCLVGRATLVLLLSRVKNRKQRVVMKLIWRDVSRKDEGENLKLFEGFPGICQCKWSEICGSAAVQKKEDLKMSSTARHFLAPWSQAESKASQSDSTDVSLDTKALSDPTKPAVMEKGREEMLAPEDQELSLIIIEEGVGLWRIKRLPHLLRVLRDALVGLAKICLGGKIHRDISEGNILCALPGGDSADKDTDPWSENKATLLDLDSEEDTSPVGDDPDLMFNEMDLQPEGGKIDAKTLDDYVKQRYGIDKCVRNPPPTSGVGDIDTPMSDSFVNQQSEGSDLDTPTSDGQVNQQFGPVKCLGRLHDLEFMVDQIRGESRVATRTGTPEFISGQLLLATPDRPVSHTYLHDLESFFWVLVWMMVTYVERGKKMNTVALRLFRKFCTTDPGALGDFKIGLICAPEASMGDIANLDNGWNLKPARDLVYFFAELLQYSIYKKAGRRPEGVTYSFVVPEGQWPTIKYVIDKFDIAINKVPTS
ncbi:hypothetical protein CTheo_7752 [Ceratobasidium theobromae]|uniref:Fungal-type protein kinase domain-containing protein n=1 Tax=Ceratobasidium theobromae TaxID=1582974 RepID=A0A5N5QAJ0_9AGAM|nr:hypothetical protein CTheo_7752 [Ceratobasidium theobromae]